MSNISTFNISGIIQDRHQQAAISEAQADVQTNHTEPEQTIIAPSVASAIAPPVVPTITQVQTPGIAKLMFFENKEGGLSVTDESLVDALRDECFFSMEKNEGQWWVNFNMPSSGSENTVSSPDIRVDMNIEEDLIKIAILEKLSTSVDPSFIGTHMERKEPCIGKHYRAEIIVDRDNDGMNRLIHQLEEGNIVFKRYNDGQFLVLNKPFNFQLCQKFFEEVTEKIKIPLLDKDSNELITESIKKIKTYLFEDSSPFYTGISLNKNKNKNKIDMDEISRRVGKGHVLLKKITEGESQGHIRVIINDTIGCSLYKNIGILLSLLSKNPDLLAFYEASKQRPH